MTWEEKEKIRNLIVSLHVECDYYSALDGLCELVDWQSFKHEAGFYSSEMMNDWVRSKAMATLTPPAPVFEIPKKKRGWPKGKLRGPRKVVVPV